MRRRVHVPPFSCFSACAVTCGDRHGPTAGGDRPAFALNFCHFGRGTRVIRLSPNGIEAGARPGGCLQSSSSLNIAVGTPSQARRLLPGPKGGGGGGT